METSLSPWDLCALGAGKCHFTKFTAGGGTAGLGYHFSYTIKGPGGILQSNSWRLGNVASILPGQTNKQTKGWRTPWTVVPRPAAGGLRAMLPIAASSLKLSTPGRVG